MFGIVQFIKKREPDIQEYSIRGNDGRSYIFRYRQKLKIHLIEQLTQSDRVEFRLSQKNWISYLTPAPLGNAEGIIICLKNDESGLIRTTAGEILLFQQKKQETMPFVPYQAVTVMPARKAEKGTIFGKCTIIQAAPLQAVTDAAQTKITVMLREHFAPGSHVTFSEILAYLKQNSYTPEGFGFSDPLFFLEQFPLVLRPDAAAQTAYIRDEKDIAPQYAEACTLLTEQGYSRPTLLQQHVFSDPGFWSDDRIMILGTTSSGKTAIPITKFLYDYEHSEEKPKLLIAVNLRTLTTQMQNMIQKRLLKHHNFTIQISTSEYISGDNEIKNGDVDIAVVIYEKLYIFASTIDHFFARYDHLLIDEAAIVADPERGAKVDILLAKAMREPGLKITVLGTPYYQWSDYTARYGFYPISVNSRPVPIYEYFYYAVPDSYNENSPRFLCADRQGNPVPSFSKPLGWTSTVLNLCISELNAGRKVLVFLFSQMRTKNLAHQLYEKLKYEQLLPDVPKETLRTFMMDFLKEYHLSFEELKGYYDSDEDYEALYYGIAFHNASMPEKLRIAIEAEFLEPPHRINGGIRVVFSTETLAYGVNSNVDTVIIAQTERFTNIGYEKMSFNMYQNCIGRSGRLGYRKYGTSYTFLRSGFEHTYFNRETSDSNIPETAIHYYTQNASGLSETLIGTLSGILHEGDADRFAFYLLSLFPTQSVFTESEIRESVHKLPMLPDTDPAAVENLISTSLRMLTEERLIQDSSTWDLGSETGLSQQEKRYLLTAKGTQFQGYALRMENYHKLPDILNRLVQNGMLYPFDYVLELGQIREFADAWEHFLIRTRDSSEVSEEQMHTAILLCEQMLPVFLKQKWISEPLCMQAMTFLQKYRNGSYPEGEDFDRMTHLRAALITCMWISGYQAHLIWEIQKFEDIRIDNIRRKLGEKVKYYTDILHAEASVQGYPVTILNQIQQLGTSLFYGIRFAWIRDKGNQVMSAELANSYHVASICAARLEYVRANGTDEDLNALQEEFTVLDATVRQILKIEGVEINV